MYAKLLTVALPWANDRVAIIVMNYLHRQRLKLLGHIRFVDIADADPSVELPDYRARIARIAFVTVTGFDWNCPQHITQRLTVTEVEDVVRPLKERIVELEAQLGAHTTSSRDSGSGKPVGKNRSSPG